MTVGALWLCSSKQTLQNCSTPFKVTYNAEQSGADNNLAGEYGYNHMLNGGLYHYMYM